MSIEDISLEDYQENLLKDLNPQQAEAAATLEGPVLIMAGAGSGKTRALTYRIANLLAHKIPPWQILAITFTNKAAGEMKSRAEKLIGAQAKKVWLSTFHSFCARLLRREIDVTGKHNSNYIIYDSGDSAAVIRECLKELNLDEERFSNIAPKISDAKNNLLDAANFRELILLKNEVSDFEKNLIKVYELYERKLLDNNALDFDDLIFISVKILQDHPDILEKYQERFRYILIDEYQDTNMAQYTLTKLLAAKYKNICVVGDADQSIYGWRGADMRNILKFEEDYPQAKVILLEQNYRSTKQILAAANGVIKHNVNRKEKNLWTENSNGEKVQFIHCVSDKSEAAFVAREIRRLVTAENFLYKDIAILYRTNAQSRVLEEKFMQLEIPYVIIGGLKFYERKEIKDILAYLRLIVNHNDNMSLLRIINVPRRGFGPINIARLSEFAAQYEISIFDAISNEDTLQRVPQLSPRIRQRLRDFSAMIISLGALQVHKNLPDFIQDVLEETGYMKMLTESEDAQKPEVISRVENLSAFVGGAVEFANSNEEPTLDNFLNHVALLTDLDEVDETESRVSLMTIHSAKGLEFPAVFLTGAEEGLLPYVSAMADSDRLEEERRLCYVAMTRAQKKLYITAAEERKNFGRSYESKVSSFIQEIPRDAIVGFSEKNSTSEVSHQITTASKRNTESKSTTVLNVTLPEKTYTPKIPERSPKIDWKTGDQVNHKKWGLGTVINYSGGYLKINFANPEIGEKVLKAIAAPIEKV